MFADDIAIISKNNNDLVKIINCVEEHSTKNNYKFNTDKCCIMSNTNPDILLYNKKIEIVKQFKYLGIIFDIDGINTKSHIMNNYMHALRLVKVNFFMFNDFNIRLSQAKQGKQFFK